MAKGGIIMDVTTAEEAKIAESAGVDAHNSHLTIKINQFTEMDK